MTVGSCEAVASSSCSRTKVFFFLCDHNSASTSSLSRSPISNARTAFSSKSRRHYSREPSSFAGSVSLSDW